MKKSSYQQYQSYDYQNKNWDHFTNQFDFHPLCGHLVPYDYQPISFNWNQLFQPIISNLNYLIQSKKIIQKVQYFPQFQYDINNRNDIIILRDTITFLHNAYRYAKNKQISENKEKQLKNNIFPKALAKPLYQICNKMKTHYGVTAGISFNWKLTNSQKVQHFYEISNSQINKYKSYHSSIIEYLQDLKLQDFRLKLYFTSQKYEIHQRLFFGAAIVTTLFMSKIIFLTCEIISIIEKSPEKQFLIIQKFKLMKNYWDRIYQQNTKLIQQLDPDYFFFILRSFLGGFIDIKFVGVQKDGQSVVLSSPGGNAGYDPTYQIFQRAYGISFDSYPSLKQTQEKLCQGMNIKMRNMMDYMKQKSLIRQYCELTSQMKYYYNQIILSYSKFMMIHSKIIEKFILKYMPKQTRQKSQGTGQIVIKDLINRYSYIKKQILI